MVLGNIGVTGASGMLGRQLLAESDRRGITVSCTSRSRPKELAPDSRWALWDLTERPNQSELDRLFPNVQAFIHAGAVVPSGASSQGLETIFSANVGAAMALGEWALARNLPLVYISGAIVYSEPDRTDILEGDDVGPRGLGGFYGLSKYLAELVFQYFAREGLDLCILRPSSIYGPGLSPTKMISKFLVAADRDGVIELSPPFEDAVDLVHARDVAVAAIEALTNDAVGVYNVGSGQLSTVMEVAEACVDVVGRGSVKAIGVSSSTPIIRFGLDCTAAVNAFSFSPTVRLVEGLAEMSDHTRSEESE